MKPKCIYTDVVKDLLKVLKNRDTINYNKPSRKCNDSHIETINKYKFMYLKDRAKFDRYDISSFKADVIIKSNKVIALKSVSDLVYIKYKKDNTIDYIMFYENMYNSKLGVYEVTYWYDPEDQIYNLVNDISNLENNQRKVFNYIRNKIRRTKCDKVTYIIPNYTHKEVNSKKVLDIRTHRNKDGIIFIHFVMSNNNDVIVSYEIIHRSTFIYDKISKRYNIIVYNMRDNETFELDYSNELDYSIRCISNNDDQHISYSAKRLNYDVYCRSIDNFDIETKNHRCIGEVVYDSKNNRSILIINFDNEKMCYILDRELRNKMLNIFTEAIEYHINMELFYRFFSSKKNLSIDYILGLFHYNKLF